MESSPLSRVCPVRPVAGYIGGKRALKKRLAKLIKATPHILYAEVFVGMGGPFFAREARPTAEVINDISSDVTNLFRILQRHPESFREELKWRLSGRAEFERLMKVNPDTLTDLERAARFLYLQRLSFGGKVVGRHFGVTRTNPGRFDVTKLFPMLEDVHERLAGVVVERLPYDEFIRRYDAEGTLFYLDPPYWGCEDDYGHDVFSRADFELLRTLLDALKGRFILSLNDVPGVRETFAGFAFEEVNLNYRVGGGVTPAREVIITGP